MFKFAIMQAILRNPVIGIVRADSAELALRSAEACLAGGITALEIAFTTPDAANVIAQLCARNPQALIGAGTVLDAATARIAILHGARFVLAPNTDPEVIRTCNRYQIPAMPGAASATEVVTALELGATIVKLFPGEPFGPAYLKALRAPLPQAPLMPSGGVSLDNVEAWFAHGAVVVSVGGELTGPAACGDFAAVTANARAFVDKVARFALAQ
ncbi:MAG: bifunctional 2-keto-4-hydroxyglutarate aldolase/2-keto-3-deoxy-6-phosphogluconate aldolase [Massilia sp.]